MRLLLQLFNSAQKKNVEEKSLGLSKAVESLIVQRKSGPAMVTELWCILTALEVFVLENAIFSTGKSMTEMGDLLFTMESPLEC